MKFMQKLGKAIMLPVMCLPLCGILMGIGYLLCPASMQGSEISGFTQTAGLFLVKAGGAVIDNIALLFAVGVGVGMAHERDGTAGVAALVSWLTMTSLLKPDLVQKLLTTAADKTTLMAFEKIENPFIGILAGLIGALCYNRFRKTALPQWLAFFSGKRSAVIIAGFVSVAVAACLLFIWPMLFGLMTKLGNSISKMGPLGAGIYAFLNRLLLPFGLHHPLNNVFWFDTVGIGDLTHFWAGDTSADVSWSLGIYMSGFFPCMMFGVPGASMAMVRSAKPEKRKYAMGVLLSGAICSFICGITEPFEFAFMFVAPALYFAYAVLYGVFSYVVALLGMRAGFAFSAGSIDLLFSSRLPAAQKTWLILPIGLAAFVVFYLVFRILIVKLNLKTPGREDNVAETAEKTEDLQSSTVVDVDALVKGLGGKENLIEIDHCFTRLRLEVKNTDLVHKDVLTQAGAKGVMITGKKTVQVVIGLNVDSVAEALNANLKSDKKTIDPDHINCCDKEGSYIPENVLISCKFAKILQPVKGKVIPCEDIPDETFSAGILGQGVGIIPEGDVVVCPVDGTVTTVADTFHAIGIKANGVDILIHVGIDTVKMKGEGFDSFVKAGDKVIIGQPLIRFDREKIKQVHHSDIVAVLLTNSDELEDVKYCI